MEQVVMIQQVCLENGAVNLGCGPLKIEMSAGTGWITHNRGDFFLNAGEKLEIEETRYPIVVTSPIKNQQIMFKVELSENHVEGHESTREIKSKDDRINIEQLSFGLKNLLDSALNGFSL